MTKEELCTTFINSCGGANNINLIFNCYTRVRINVKSMDQVNVSEIEKIEGIIGVVCEGSQVQIIVGPGKATKLAQLCNKIFEELGGSNQEQNVQSVEENTDNSKDYLKTKAEIRKKTSNPFNNIIKKISGIFIPIIPMFIACGLLLGIYTICDQQIKGFSSTTFGIIFNVVSSSVFTVLNVIVGYNATKEFGGDAIIGAALAGALTNPLMNGADGNGIWLGFYTFKTAEVGIFTVLLVSIGVAYLEKLIRKFMPDIIDAFMTPLLAVIIMSTVALFVLQPIGAGINVGLTNVFQWISNNCAWLLGIVPLFYLLLVLTGTHHSLMAVSTALIGTMHATPLVPVQLMAGAAEIGAAGYIALKTKNTKLKKNIIGALPIGVLGIDEPLIWGMSVPLKRPFIAAGLGGFIGGTILACLKITANVPESTGIEAALVCNIPWIFVVCFAISIVAGFIIQFLIGFKDTYTKLDPVTNKNIEVSVETSFILKKYQEYRLKHPKKEKVTVQNGIYAPTEGKLIALKDVEDATFSQGILGEGFAIIPTSNIITSPVNGTIDSIFDTKHAFCVVSNDGVEVLVHVGINTVELKGECFTLLKKAGDKVNQGDPIIKVDFKKIKELGYKITTPVIITNFDNYKGFDYKQNYNEIVKNKSLITILNK